MLDRTTDHRTESLAALLEDAGRSVPDASPGQLRNLTRLRELRHRLISERFQLAVVGQFKRGKSTLLNALLGARIMPTAVVPVTAIPTFVERNATLTLRSIFLSGGVEEMQADRPDALTERLAELVTEEANPRNQLGLARVELGLKAPLLESGVVLIDTPGIGSSFTHNTETAQATLPECDAALFVVSPDPPITEVEIGYLKRVRATASRVIVVLNKVDTIEPSEIATSHAFLRMALSDAAGVGEETPVFVVSARAGLNARLNHDAPALAASGLDALEQHLAWLATHEKHSVLASAIARKATAIMDRLLAETEIRLRALQLPMTDLDARIQAFGAAVRKFDDERRMLGDLLGGDRRRIQEEIERDADGLRRHARGVLEAEAGRAFTRFGDADRTRQALAGAIPAFFEKEAERLAVRVRERLAGLIGAHQQRANEIIERVEHTAAELMETSLRSAQLIEPLEIRRQAYWVGADSAEGLSFMAASAVERLLPQQLRQARVRGRMVEAIRAAVRRNVENLRWAMVQNVDDAFRKLAATLDQHIADSIEATRGIMLSTRLRRLEHGDRVAAEIADIASSLAKLTALHAEIARFQGKEAAESGSTEDPSPVIHSESIRGQERQSSREIAMTSAGTAGE